MKSDFEGLSIPCSVYLNNALVDLGNLGKVDCMEDNSVDA